MYPQTPTHAHPRPGARRVRFIVSGGAPLAPHVEDFCNVCLAPVLQARAGVRVGGGGGPPWRH